MEERESEKLRQELLTKSKLLTQYNESFKFIFNSQSDVFYDSDLVTNKVKFSDAFEKEFGYKIIDNITPLENWISHIHPDDEMAVMADYWRILASEDSEWKYNYRFLRADNSVANVLSRGIILRNAGGKAYRMIGSIQDMSKQKVLEEKLGMEIEIKEQQIAEALEDAKASERSELGKELHDNVNQLLGVSKLYLDMAKQGGEGSELYLSRSSEYTNDAIEEIRKLTKGLTTDIIKNHGLCEAIDNIIRVTMEVNPVKISYEMKSFKEGNINNKFKLTVYRIIQEQLNNILKHAKAVEVSIKLLQTKKSIVLTISDNGIGFNTAEKAKGIGIANINSRATFYNGTTDLVSRPGQGCLLTVTFPVSDKLLERTAAV
jgi:PAS domain S-box-containing protein